MHIFLQLVAWTLYFFVFAYFAVRVVQLSLRLVLDFVNRLEHAEFVHIEKFSGLVDVELYNGEPWLYKSFFYV